MMPIFEVQHPDGCQFEVDAPNMKAAQGMVPANRSIAPQAALLALLAGQQQGRGAR
jgi:hypothetical protein